MKKIIRMVIFSGVAIFITALWNKGFVIKPDWVIYLKAALLIAAVYYLVLPISKLILLPLNIISLGLVSVIFNSVVLFFLFNQFNLITVNAWTFSGFKISSFINIFIASFSISTIINLLEKIV
ncbi:MAG: phage holin family protein [Patescibacteria group bacterium]